MTEELREKYAEDKIHYDVIRTIVQEEVKMAVAPVQADVKSINKRQDWFYSLSLLVFGFLFGVQFFVWKELSGKANTTDIKTEFDKVDKTYLQKWDYYQIEEDEHRVMKEVIRNPSQADYLLGIINNNIVEKLGYKYQTRTGK